MGGTDRPGVTTRALLWRRSASILCPPHRFSEVLNRLHSYTGPRQVSARAPGTFEYSLLMDVEQAVARLAHNVRSHPSVDLLVLYGSRARGEAHAGSYWDLGYLARTTVDHLGC